jgi:hypothetical protein
LDAGYKGSSDLYIDANIQLAVAAGKQLAALSGKKIHLLLPDATEYYRAIKLFKTTLAMADGVTMGHFQEAIEPANPFLSSLEAWKKSAFSGGDAGDPAVAGADADLYFALNASTVELPDLERYCAERAGSKPVITWNMELDTLRSDLGLLGFPPKDLQYRFLSLFKPVFYIRQRDYSKTVAVAPFIINYSGALFREYPGPWQVMLRQDNGVYACVAEDAERRYGLGEFKAELTRAMGLDTEPEGSALAFLRSGYKTSTWWEDDVDKESSNGWRS